RKAARHHHGHPPTGPCQSERSFDKQLIEICVSVTLPSLCARLAGKRRECGLTECTRSAKHFPGWVSDDRIKPARVLWADCVMKDLGELQLPVEEPLSARDRLHVIQERPGDVARKNARTADDFID